MKRLMYNSKKACFEWSDFIPQFTKDYGISCVKKNKYVEDKVRINNNEVSTGTSRTALYTMPGGVDNGIRYSPLYDSSGLDVTEIEANKRILQNAKDSVSEMIKNEVDNQIKEVEAVTASKSSGKDSDSSSSE